MTDSRIEKIIHKDITEPKNKKNYRIRERKLFTVKPNDLFGRGKRSDIKESIFKEL